MVPIFRNTLYYSLETLQYNFKKLWYIIIYEKVNLQREIFKHKLELRNMDIKKRTDSDEVSIR